MEKRPEIHLTQVDFPSPISLALAVQLQKKAKVA
jgi:hypothetical protein